jgi:hypothetical protein
MREPFIKQANLLRRAQRWDRAQREYELAIEVRDNDVRDAKQEGHRAEAIAKAFELSPSRVRQIVRGAL